MKRSQAKVVGKLLFTLLLFGLLIDFLPPSNVAFGCGPFFPNTLLNQGDQAVLTAPEVNFQNEIKRMRLIGPVFQAKPAKDPASQSLQADLDDLYSALAGSGVPVDQINEIVKQHRAERRKIDVKADDSLRPTNSVRLNGGLPQIVPGLPPEFADYFRGAIAWHQNQLEEARAAWKRVLERPASERKYKATWAAFMLGRGWEEENEARAIAYFRQVRALAKAGCVDSLGLATSSLGFEARLHLRAQRFSEAIDLYLEQAASGEPSAVNSLQWAASHALRRGSTALEPLASHPRAQRVVTAYVIAGGWQSSPIDIDGPLKEALLLLEQKAAARSTLLPPPKAAWHTTKAPVLIWLDAVERAKVKDVASSEQLALAAYQAGQMDIARRWLVRAQSTPAADWLRAKLLLYDGKVDAAAEILAKLCRAFPVETGRTNPLAQATLASSLYLTDGDFSRISMAHRLHGELGVFTLARRQYTEALQALLQGGYWDDGAYVAENVLTLDELKTFVDLYWPHQPRAEPSGSDIAAGEDANPAYPWRLAQNQMRESIRYLLARRLMRANRRPEAEAYFPNHLQESYAELRQALDAGENEKLPGETRAENYFEAARITRQLGLELVGTEAGPDWLSYGGNFESTPMVAARMSLSGTNFLGPSITEIKRAEKHVPTPNVRWHYRRTASTLALEGARLLRDAEAAELTRDERVCVLMQAAQAVHARDYYAAETPAASGTQGEALLEQFPSAILAWKAARLLPDNDDQTARVLCTGGSWIKYLDPRAADLFYKALVRRCRKTVIGAEADRLRWFPVLDAQGNLKKKGEPPKDKKN
jgi:hypothetical protein